MADRIQQGGLQVSNEIFDLVANDLTPARASLLNIFGPLLRKSSMI